MFWDPIQIFFIKTKYKICPYDQCFIILKFFDLRSLVLYYSYYRLQYGFLGWFYQTRQKPLKVLAPKRLQPVLIFTLDVSERVTSKDVQLSFAQLKNWKRPPSPLCAAERLMSKDNQVILRNWKTDVHRSSGPLCAT